MAAVGLFGMPLGKGEDLFHSLSMYQLPPCGRPEYILCLIHSEAELCTSWDRVFAWHYPNSLLSIVFMEADNTTPGLSVPTPFPKLLKEKDLL